MRVPSDDVIRPGNHFTINSVAPNEDVVSDRERSGVQRWHNCRDVWMAAKERAEFVLVVRSSAQPEYAPWRSSGCCGNREVNPS